MHLMSEEELQEAILVALLWLGLCGYCFELFEDSVSLWGFFYCFLLLVFPRTCIGSIFPAFQWIISERFYYLTQMHVITYEVLQYQPLILHQTSVHHRCLTWNSFSNFVFYLQPMLSSYNNMPKICKSYQKSLALA